MEPCWQSFIIFALLHLLCWPSKRWINLMLFVCWVFSSHTRNFHSFGDITIISEGIHILTYTWHSRPLSSEGPLTCHTFCATGHPLKWSSSRTSDTHTCCPACGSGTVTTCFKYLGLSWPGIEPYLPHVRQTLIHYATEAVINLVLLLIYQSVCLGWFNSCIVKTKFSC